MAKIYPRCEKKIHGKDYALSAKGFVLPCCWCDTIQPSKDTELMKLFSPHLHISKNETIDEILLSDEWLNFKDSITKDYEKAPKVCKRFCGHQDKIKGVVEND